jgi:hypothetical protein
MSRITGNILVHLGLVQAQVGIAGRVAHPDQGADLVVAQAAAMVMAGISLQSGKTCKHCVSKPLYHASSFIDSSKWQSLKNEALIRHEKSPMITTDSSRLI